jgi:photosystem II stability/assembly factor-like uncharacterized protein
VLRTTDRGRTWAIADTPLAAGPSTGIFSIAFRDAMHGIIVGGDYTKENEAIDNLAVTTDGGVTWDLVRGLSGYRSAAAYLPGSNRPALVAVGPSGVDYSTDDGRTWMRLEIRNTKFEIRNPQSAISSGSPQSKTPQGFDTLSVARGFRSRAIGWAAGARGAIAKLVFDGSTQRRNRLR